MAYHWPQRQNATAIRMGDIVPESDDALAKLRLALRQIQQGTLAVIDESLAGLTPLPRRTDLLLREPSPAAISSLALGFVRLCAVWRWDAEQVIEAAIEKDEARKRPPTLPPPPSAPTAQESRAPRQFTL